LLLGGDPTLAAVTSQADYYNILISRQFAQPVLQLIQRNQNATGYMELIPARILDGKRVT